MKRFFFSAEGGTWYLACARTFSTTELFLYPWLFETGPHYVGQIGVKLTIHVFLASAS